MCRSFAEQLVNGLMPVDTNLEVLKRRINYRRKSKADLIICVDRALNQLNRIRENIVVKLKLAGRESDEERISVEEVIKFVVETINLRRWDFGISPYTNIVYSGNVASTKIQNAYVLRYSIIRASFYLIQTVSVNNVSNGSVNIDVSQEEGKFITVRITNPKASLDLLTEDPLSWPEGVEHKETELPFARFLLETRGGSLKVENGAFVLKIPS